MFGGKKAKELEEELLALREKQNRLQEQISNIAKAKDSAEETANYNKNACNTGDLLGSSGFDAKQ